jgi:hypothetical protein
MTSTEAKCRGKGCCHAIFVETDFEKHTFLKIKSKWAEDVAWGTALA